MENPPSILVRRKFIILAVIAGAGILGSFFLLYKLQLLSPYKVEVITAPTQTPSNSTVPSSSITIDISGAVTSTGLYKMDKGSRVGEAIEKAGGLTAKADSSWVDKNINRAALLSDGQKIYIPKIDEVQQTKVLSANNLSGGSTIENVADGSQTEMVSINNSSQKELEELWGIGPATAQKLIEQRPYSSVEELLTKKILKKNVYDKIKIQLTL